MINFNYGEPGFKTKRKYDNKTGRGKCCPGLWRRNVNVIKIMHHALMQVFFFYQRFKSHLATNINNNQRLSMFFRLVLMKFLR